MFLPLKDNFLLLLLSGWDFKICLLFSNHTLPFLNCTHSFPHKILSPFVLCISQSFREGLHAQEKLLQPQRQLQFLYCSLDILVLDCPSAFLHILPLNASTGVQEVSCLAEINVFPRCCAELTHIVKCLNNCTGACVMSDSHKRLDPVSTEVKVKLPLTLQHRA